MTSFCFGCGGRHSFDDAGVSILFTLRPGYDLLKVWLRLGYARSGYDLAAGQQAGGLAR